MLKLNAANQKLKENRAVSRAVSICALGLAVLVEMLIKSSSPAVAQIIPDSTLGSERSQVRSGVRIQGQASDQIEGGAVRGASLFHSFQDFNVGEEQRVFFANPPGVSNILTRVTGNHLSNIQGRLGVEGNANLFLLNPNGIVFGSGAELDLRGSFTASTASRFTFPDGSEFSATQPQAAPLLSIQVPIGLQMGGRSGDIVNAATISLEPAQSITLQGRTITQTGTLATTAGAIQLSATDDLRLKSGSASVSTIGGDAVLQAGRTLTLSDQAIVDTGVSLRSGGGNSGQITLQAGRMLELVRGAKLFSTVDEGVIGNAGAIHLSAGSRLLIDSGTVSNTMRGIGNGAAIHLVGQSIAIRNSSRVFSSTSGRGNAGVLRIATGDRLLIDNSVVAAGVNQDGSGRGGAILITPLATTGMNQVFVRNGAILSAATDDIGTAGRLQISTGQFTVDNAEVSTGTLGSGIAGALDIDAVQSVRVRNQGRITSSTSSAGNGGVLTIRTRDLSVQSGGQIVSASGAFAAGNAGQLNIFATGVITVSDRANGIQSLLSSQSDGLGSAGGLSITARQLQVDRGAGISVSGVGNPGNLTVNADAVRLDRGILEAITRSGTGANIQVTANDYLLLGDRSAITARADKNGSGGNLRLNADFVIALPNTDSDVVANAFKGTGGQITITTQTILGLSQRAAIQNNGTNDIDASSRFGAPGSVTINQPAVDPSRGLAELPTTTIDATRQMASACPTNTQEADRLGSFIVSGRGGLPPNPIDLLSSDNVVTDWVTSNSKPRDTAVELPPAEPRGAIVEAQGWIRGNNGEIQLVAATATPPLHSIDCR